MIIAWRCRTWRAFDFPRQPATGEVFGGVRATEHPAKIFGVRLRLDVEKGARRSMVANASCPDAVGRCHFSHRSSANATQFSTK